MIGRSFAWIIPVDDGFPFSPSGGVSGDYVIPSRIVDRPLSDFHNAELNIVLRRANENFIFARIHAAEVVRFAEADDYKVSVDVLGSIRCFRDLSDGGMGLFRVPEPFGIKAGGLSSLEPEEDALLCETIRKGFQRSFRPYSEQDYLRLDGVNLKHPKIGIIARDLVAAVKRNFALSELHGGIRPEVANPMVNLIANYLKCRGWTGPMDSIMQEVGRLSEVAAPLIAKMNGDLTVPAVDLDFSDVEASSVLIRSFHAQSMLSRTDRADSVAKTENAERRHQEMLIDIACRMRQSGIDPKQTTSIDLLFESDQQGGIQIFEIKSATPENVLSQVSKGVMQLLVYSYELGVSGRTVSRQSLILERVCGFEFEEKIKRILARVSIDVLFYDRDAPWPMRVDGLLK